MLGEENYGLRLKCELVVGLDRGGDVANGLI